jgi:arabinose-5-phosphate isomerase
VIVTGMGKSGHIARKIAATMRSTGTSALYLHPGEASHGDLGVITKQDVVLAITWSGETAELGDILHYCNHMA